METNEKVRRKEKAAQADRDTSSKSVHLFTAIPQQSECTNARSLRRSSSFSCEEVPKNPCDDENRKDVCTWHKLEHGHNSNPSEHQETCHDSGNVKHITYYRNRQHGYHILADVQDQAKSEGKQLDTTKDEISRKRFQGKATLPRPSSSFI